MKDEMELALRKLKEKDGKYFATQRGYSEYKDWWEFHGGKMEKGETVSFAMSLKAGCSSWKQRMPAGLTEPTSTMSTGCPQTGR